MFTSYEQPIWILNFCNKFGFTSFFSKYWQDKSFKLRPKYIKKCQCNSLHTKNKNTLQHLKLGKLKFGICKIGCSMSWTRYKRNYSINYVATKFLNEKHYENMLPVHQSERPDQSNRNSPIHLAAARGNVDAVRILMESNVTKNKEPINKRYFMLFEKLA